MGSITDCPDGNHHFGIFDLERVGSSLGIAIFFYTRLTCHKEDLRDILDAIYETEQAAKRSKRESKTKKTPSTPTHILKNDLGRQTGAAAAAVKGKNESPEPVQDPRPSQRMKGPLALTLEIDEDDGTSTGSDSCPSDGELSETDLSTREGWSELLSDARRRDTEARTSAPEMATAASSSTKKLNKRQLRGRGGKRLKTAGRGRNRRKVKGKGGGRSTTLAQSIRRGSISGGKITPIGKERRLRSASVSSAGIIRQIVRRYQTNSGQNPDLSYVRPFTAMQPFGHEEAAHRHAERLLSNRRAASATIHNISNTLIETGRELVSEKNRNMFMPERSRSGIDPAVLRSSKQALSRRQQRTSPLITTRKAMPKPARVAPVNDTGVSDTLLSRRLYSHQKNLDANAKTKKSMGKGTSKGAGAKRHVSSHPNFKSQHVVYPRCTPRRPLSSKGMGIARARVTTAGRRPKEPEKKTILGDTRATTTGREDSKPRREPTGKRPVTGVSLFEYLEHSKHQSDRVVLADDVRGRRRNRFDRPYDRRDRSTSGVYMRNGQDKEHMLTRLQIH